MALAVSLVPRVLQPMDSEIVKEDEIKRTYGPIRKFESREVWISNRNFTYGLMMVYGDDRPSIHCIQ